MMDFLVGGKGTPDALRKGGVCLDKECTISYGIVKIRLGEEYVS